MIAYFLVEETVARAQAARCFDLVLAARRYGEWRPGHSRPLEVGSVLHVGHQIAVEDGDLQSVMQVMRLDPHREVEMHYVGGDLLGPVHWELAPHDGATRVRLAYRGVRPNSVRAEQRLAGDGLQRHRAGMREALAGMRALVESAAGDCSGADLFAALHTQRAVRHFRPDPIPDAALREIVAAATRAPSARNSQPWVFVAVRDPARKSEIRRHYLAAWQAAQAYTLRSDADADIRERADYPAMMRAVDTLARQLDHAPVLVLCGLDTARLGPMADASGHILAPQSAYASIFPAVQNLMLAARGLGIGSTLTTVFQAVENELRRAVDLPEHIHIAALVPLGYPRRPFRATQRRPLAEVAFLDRWSDPLVADEAAAK